MARERGVEVSNQHPTPFAELNDLLADLVERQQDILGDNFVGAYVTGGFALGAGDMSSDCDFLVVTAAPVTEEQERALGELHDEIPTRDGYWAINLEGAYAPREDVETLEGLGRDWLDIDRGWREMKWTTHCNVEDVRWVLRERGVVLAGVDPSTYAAEVPADLLRERARSLLDVFLPDLMSWADFELLWTQRYAVETICRLLNTLEMGEVNSKRACLDWALRALPERWHDLIQQAIVDRPLPWNDPSRPESIEPTKEFAEYAKERTVRSE